MPSAEAAAVVVAAASPAAQARRLERTQTVAAADVERMSFAAGREPSAADQTWRAVGT